MIQYIYDKNDISEQFINKISSVSEPRQNKLDKICKVFYQNKEREDLFKKMSKVKIINSQKKLKEDIENILNVADTDLVNFKKISENYIEPKNSINEMVIKNHIAMKHSYWNRHNANYLQRKNNKVRNYSDMNESNTLYLNKIKDNI